MSFIVTCTPVEHQRPLVAADVASKPPIPGGSTFEYCSESDPENDIFIIGSFLLVHLSASNH